MQTPPHNLDAERALLGAMMLTPDAVYSGLTRLTASRFYSPTHQAIFAAIRKLFDAGSPIDVVSLTSQLHAEGHTSIGTGELMSLSAGTPAATNADHYADIVDDLGRRRDLLVAAHDLASNVNGETTADVLLSEHQRRLFDIAAGDTTDPLQLLGASLTETLDDIEAQAENPGSLTGAPSGYTDLDKYMSGFQRASLTVVGARPAMGKTSLALDIVRHLGVDLKLPVVVCSLEMTRLELNRRLICSLARVDSTKIRDGKLNDNDWARIAEAAQPIAEAPIWILDSPNITLSSIRAHSRRAKAQSNDLAAVVVDYLQLMSGSPGADNRQVEIAEISRGLKILARELDCPVIALSQLSRNLEIRTNKRPMLADLRESGAIEQDADNVLFLYRDEVYNPDSADRGQAELIIAKQRNGPIGTVRLAWLPHFTSFADLARP